MQASLGSILAALEGVSGPGKVLSNDGKPWKGPQSKAKRAALVVDALREAIAGAAELVSNLLAACDVTQIRSIPVSMQQ